MAWPIAIPYVAPAVGEGLLWGAGVLGSGLAALGIIENKDAIREGISNLGTSIKRGAENGIRSWSEAMSPKGPLPNPSIDQRTGRYVAVPDAVRVANPVVEQVLLPDVLRPDRVTQATATSGTSSRTSRRKPAGSTTSSGASTSGTTPDPRNNNNNNSTRVSRLGKAWQWVKKHPKTSIAVGAAGFYPTREWIVKPTLNYAGPAIGNVVSYITAGETPFNIPAVANDSTDLWYNGGVGKVLNPLPTREQFAPTYQETDAAVEKNIAPTDTFTRAPIAEPDTSAVRNGVVFLVK